jgi:ribosomal protein L33
MRNLHLFECRECGHRFYWPVTEGLVKARDLGVFQRSRQFMERLVNKNAIRGYCTVCMKTVSLKNKGMIVKKDRTKSEI